jgi:hypothetical protein
VYD